MRISSVIRYHALTSKRSLLLMSALILIAFIGILICMQQFAAYTTVQTIYLGANEITITNSSAGKPSLGSPFGTPGFIYILYMLAFAYHAITSDRRYLLSNNLTRYEFIAGTFLSAVGMALTLTGIQYILDLICRTATWLMGFSIRGMKWTPKLIFCSTNDYLPALISQLGNMIYMAGSITLIVLLFTRWKKTCIALILASMLLPVMLASFLPLNWQNWIVENIGYVVNQAIKFFDKYKWLFLIDMPAHYVLLQQSILGAVMYGISYLVIRRLPVRTK